MEAVQLKNGSTEELELNPENNMSDTTEMESCVENGGVPDDLHAEAQLLKGLLTDSGFTPPETVGFLPENTSVVDDVTVNGPVSNGDFQPSDITSGITSSLEHTTLKMSGKDISHRCSKVVVDVRNESDLVSQDSEDLFFDPSPDETEAEQWHEASDNTQHASSLYQVSAGDNSQAANLPQLSSEQEINTAENSTEVNENTGVSEIDQTNITNDAGNNQPCGDNLEDSLDQPCDKSNDLCDVNSKNCLESASEQNIETDLDAQCYENKEEEVSDKTSEKNSENLLDSQCEENKDGNKESNLDIDCEGSENNIPNEKTEGEPTFDDSLSNNSASIDLGKFGEISLSTQLSTQMSEANNLAVAQERDTDGLPADDIQKPECQPADTENTKTPAASNDPLPAVSCDQPLGFPPLEPLQIPKEDLNMSDTFTEKAVGSGRISVERKSYEMSPGHVEIDLSAQLENIFAGDDSPKISESQNTPKSVQDIFPDSPKTKTFESSLLVKKENADSGVDNDDEFETLDKEIVMLRERYRNTQDRIQKALHDDSNLGRKSKDTKEMSPESAYARFRSQRLGSAPALGEKYDLGIGNTLSAKVRMEKEDTYRSSKYGARRIVADQAELCSKLKNASQSFEELEEEIRSLKYDFLESQARRDQFYEDYDRQVEEDEHKGSSGYGMYGTSPEENPYLNYYLNRQAPNQAEDEFEFRLPSTTRRPWSSYGRSYTEDPGMYSRRDYRGDEMEGAAGGYGQSSSSVPLYQRHRTRPKERVSCLDEPRKREVVPAISEEPPTYKPGKATSEFLRQIYAGQQSKPFSFDPDWDGDIDSVESAKGGNTKSTWKPTSQDYPSGYEPKSQLKYKLDNYDIDDSEINQPSRNYNTSYKTDKFLYEKGREYGASASAIDADNPIKTGNSGKTNWDDNAFTGSLPRNVSRSNKQKHTDISSAECKREKREAKPSKHSFQYELGTDLVTKSRYSNKWDETSPDRLSKSKYSSRSKEIDKSPEMPIKSKYSSGKEYSGSKSDYSNFKSSSKSDISSGKQEKPFTSRFLQKRHEARESAESKPGEGKTKDKPFQSRFLRKSTGDLTSMDDSSKPPKLSEAAPESKSTEEN